jgi:hypothetical protein
MQPVARYKFAIYDWVILTDQRQHPWSGRLRGLLPRGSHRSGHADFRIRLLGPRLRYVAGGWM